MLKAAVAQVVLFDVLLLHLVSTLASQSLVGSTSEIQWAKANLPSDWLMCPRWLNITTNAIPSLLLLFSV